MGKLLRLSGVNLTDTTAPRLPHSAGVGGVTHRYVAGHLEANDGARVLTWPETYGGSPAAAYVSGAVGPLLGTDTAAGIRYLDSSNSDMTGAYTQLRATAAATNPATVALVINAPKDTFQSVQHNGYSIHRLSNGSYVVWDGTNYIQVPAPDGWVVLVATLNGPSSALLVGGTDTAGTNIVAPTSTQGNFIIGDWKTTAAPKIAEVIRWDRALTAQERSEVRAALRNHYTAAA